MRAMHAQQVLVTWPSFVVSAPTILVEWPAYGVR
jgi:hypothetical protein